MRVCIVIPAYEPGGEFVPYAQEVLAAGLGPVLVVDDGSGPAYAPVFAALAEMGCTVLTHEQNRGKGAALKTALRWYGAHEDGCAGIVTADCDAYGKGCAPRVRGHGGLPGHAGAGLP